MANTGQPWEIPFPLASDPPNAPQSLQDQAEKVASSLGFAYPCTSLTRPAAQRGLIIYESDTDRLYVSDGTDWALLSKGYDDTGWVDAIAEGFAATANGTLTSGSVRRRNGFVSLYLTCTTTAGFAAGDFGNVTMVTMPAGYIPGVTNGGLNSGTSSGVLNFLATTAGGLQAVSGTGAVAAGGAFNITGTYGL